MGGSRRFFARRVVIIYAKFWLNPVSVDSSFGFKTHELRKMVRIVEEKAEFFTKKTVRCSVEFLIATG